MGDNKLELPPHLVERPKTRYKWEFPTAWLLGTQIATSLREMGLSAISSFDARDWMTANKINVGAGEDESLWIDFFADTGDSPRLVYQLAYLLQQPSLEVLCAVDEKRDALLADDECRVLALPRGAALVVGGDTAYPIATRRRLLERVRAPFIWARNELGDKAAPLDPPVKLLGVPGNHDYYNELVGFERQFHADGEPDPPIHDRVELPGYQLEQHASYFAAELAFGWQLWGFDIERKEIDHRQAKYFRDVDNGKNNRIIVTSKPAFVYRGRSEHEETITKSIDRVLAQANKSTQPYNNHGKLADDQLRLDLSGDTHIYQRYWGKTIEPKTTEPHERSAERIYRKPDTTEEQRPTPNYASVVSGLGGAFHHPSQIHRGKEPARCSWPSEMDSTCELMQRLIRPRKVFQAGAVGIVGFFVGALCFAAVWVSEGPMNVLDIPFALPGCPGKLPQTLLHLGIVTSIVVTVVGLGLGLWGLYRFGRWLAKPIELMKTPRGFTHWLSHNPLTHWVLRWFGGSRRNMWGLLKTLPAWLLAIGACVGVIIALSQCRYLVRAGDGFAPVYSVTVVLSLGVAALGLFVAGKGRGCIPRIFFGLLGLLTGLAFVWTPYAWTKLVLCSEERAVAVMFLSYVPIRLMLKEFLTLRWVSKSRLARQVFALLFYYLVLTLFCAIPWLVIHPDGVTTSPVPKVGIVVAALFGAYFSCLWIGWYFYVCLQFGGHGNEAGSAARVVSFAQFVRIKLTENRADVYVIAAEDRKPVRSRWRIWDKSFWNTSEMTPNARLIDHFVIKR